MPKIQYKVTIEIDKDEIESMLDMAVNEDMLIDVNELDINNLMQEQGFRFTKIEAVNGKKGIKLLVTIENE